MLLIYNVKNNCSHLSQFEMVKLIIYEYWLGIVASLAARARTARRSLSAASAGPPGLPVNSDHGSPRRDSSARMLPLPTTNHFHAALATPEDDTGIIFSPFPHFLPQSNFSKKNLIPVRFLSTLAAECSLDDGERVWLFAYSHHAFWSIVFC